MGGHAAQLARCLHRLGVTASHWPDDLTVLQLGDLLGGVDDRGVVALVDPPHRSTGRA